MPRLLQPTHSCTLLSSGSCTTASSRPNAHERGLSKTEISFAQPAWSSALQTGWGQTSAAQLVRGALQRQGTRGHKMNSGALLPLRPPAGQFDVERRSDKLAVCQRRDPNPHGNHCRRVWSSVGKAAFRQGAIAYVSYAASISSGPRTAEGRQASFDRHPNSRCPVTQSRRAR